MDKRKLVAVFEAHGLSPDEQADIEKLIETDEIVRRTWEREVRYLEDAENRVRARKVFTLPSKDKMDRKKAERYCQKLPLIGEKMRLPGSSEMMNHFRAEPPEKPGDLQVWVDGDWDKFNALMVGYEDRIEKPEWRQYQVSPETKLRVVCTGNLTGQEMADAELERYHQSPEYKRQQENLRRYSAMADKSRERIEKREAAEKSVAEPAPEPKRLCPINWR